MRKLRNKKHRPRYFFVIFILFGIGLFLVGQKNYAIILSRRINRIDEAIFNISKDNKNLEKSISEIVALDNLEFVGKARFGLKMPVMQVTMINRANNK